ncbi:MAG: outer membrane protein assembly factor BamE [Hydrogenophaga sp.]|uniref:outer membrane protein assembly factor BamE domain-containing protein n=1 Tax=Hydrogenophaga sp. TaxID=1904254 RepID=UPI001D6B56B3|nr:outer membrane protein assembly factor BamE [Hydrogenophaga sp.]MBX3609261.1 outer membrane protein assembly factor BamE [Hydrogenophaga sp.]
MTRPDTRSAWWRIGRTLTAVLAAVGFVGACDLQNIAELEPGVSTEADVREKFGQPEAVWEGEDGAQIYEYNRQPEGVVNYMITVGANGILVKVSQVLTEENFARVQPGMAVEQVRRMLGKPRKVQTFALSGETSQDWRYQPKGQTETMIFTVTYNRDLRVIKTGSMPDPDLQRR